MSGAMPPPPPPGAHIVEVIRYYTETARTFYPEWDVPLVPLIGKDPSVGGVGWHLRASSDPQVVLDNLAALGPRARRVDGLGSLQGDSFIDVDVDHPELLPDDLRAALEREPGLVTETRPGKRHHRFRLRTGLLLASVARAWGEVLAGARQGRLWSPNEDGTHVAVAPGSIPVISQELLELLRLPSRSSSSTVAWADVYPVSDDDLDEWLRDHDDERQSRWLAQDVAQLRAKIDRARELIAAGSSEAPADPSKSFQVMRLVPLLARNVARKAYGGERAYHAGLDEYEAICREEGDWVKEERKRVHDYRSWWCKMVAAIEAQDEPPEEVSESYWGGGHDDGVEYDLSVWDHLRAAAGDRLTEADDALIRQMMTARDADEEWSASLQTAAASNGQAAVEVEATPEPPRGPLAAGGTEVGGSYPASWNPPLGGKSGDSPLPLFDFGELKYPIDALGPIMSRLATVLRHDRHADEAMTGQFALGAVSTAAALVRRVKMELIEDWHDEPNLYLTPVVGTGEHKTPTLRVIVKEIHEYVDDRKKIEAPDITLRQAELKAADAAYRRVSNSRSRASEEDVKDAALTLAMAEARADVAPYRLLFADSTPEQLGALLALHDGRLAHLEDEPVYLDHIVGRYQNGEGNPDAFLKGWDGSSLMVDRRGGGRHKRGEEILVPAVRIVFLAGVQPAKLAKMMVTHEGRGVWERQMMSYSRPLAGSRKYHQPPHPEFHEAVDDWDAALRWLLRAPELSGLTAVSTTEAAAAFNRWRDEVETRLHAVGRMAVLMSGKVHASVLRAATLLALIDLALLVLRSEASGVSNPLRQSGLLVVDEAAMLRAIRLGDYWLQAGAMIESSASELAVVETILTTVWNAQTTADRDTGEIKPATNRTLQRALKMKQHVFKPLIERLADCRWIDVAPGVRKDSQTYRLRDGVHDAWKVRGEMFS